MPFAANRSKDCCWLLARVNDLRPLKMIGSTLEICQPLCGDGADRIGLTVGHDYGRVPLNGLVRNGAGQIDGEENRVLVAPERVEGRLKEHCTTSA